MRLAATVTGGEVPELCVSAQLIDPVALLVVDVAGTISGIVTDSGLSLTCTEAVFVWLAALPPGDSVHETLTHCPVSEPVPA